MPCRIGWEFDPQNLFAGQRARNQRGAAQAVLRHLRRRSVQSCAEEAALDQVGSDVPPAGRRGVDDAFRGDSAESVDTADSCAPDSVFAGEFHQLAFQQNAAFFPEQLQSEKFGKGWCMDFSVRGKFCLFQLPEQFLSRAAVRFSQSDRGKSRGEFGCKQDADPGETLRRKMRCRRTKEFYRKGSFS